MKEIILKKPYLGHLWFFIRKDVSSEVRENDNAGRRAIATALLPKAANELKQDVNQL